LKHIMGSALYKTRVRIHIVRFINTIYPPRSSRKLCLMALCVVFLNRVCILPFRGKGRLACLDAGLDETLRLSASARLRDHAMSLPLDCRILQNEVQRGRGSSTLRSFVRSSLAEPRI
jgi:hypothetical protein